MKNEEKLKLANEIRFDVEEGVFDLFPKMKERLLFIAGKLFESAFVINSSKELSEGELNTLEQQGYID